MRAERERERDRDRILAVVLRCGGGRNSYGIFKEEESYEKQAKGEKMCSCFRHPLFQLSIMKNLRHRTIIIIIFW